MLDRREQERSAQRARILDAARALFASRGFEAVTMAEIADLAGVARATVFNHFGSKRALVEAITADVLDHYSALLDRALADEKTSTPTLVRAVFDLMGWGIESLHGFYRGVFREIMRIQVALEEGGLATRAAERAHERLVRLLARGQQRGDLGRELSTEDLASAFASLANGTITRWLYESGSEPLRSRMRAAAEVFLGPVAAVEIRDEPPPDLLPETPLAPPERVVSLARARARRKR